MIIAIVTITWLRTNGVNTNGTAAKVMSFAKLSVLTPFVPFRAPHDADGGGLEEAHVLRGGRVLLTERITVASNCSTGNCPSSFDKRISSKSSN